MDYFYVSSTSAGPRVGVHGMSTRELRHRLKELGKSILGARNVLVKRYQMYAPEEDQDDAGEGEMAGGHAYDKPMMVMVDEDTGNKYMRSVKHKGLGDGRPCLR